MENAADALKMGAAILIFIIAIASSFSLFGLAKQTADSIIAMRDKQSYLEAAELDNGVLYTSSSAIQKSSATNEQISSVSGFTTNGDRIVDISDVFSTIYRYSVEKYGVTIVDSSKNIIARFDSQTEAGIQQCSGNNDLLNTLFSEMKDSLEKNTKNKYATPNFDANTLKRIYNIEINTNVTCGAPWNGNPSEILKRVNADIKGSYYSYNNQIHDGGRINLLNALEGKTIVEVTNEIDESQYLEDDGQGTNLLQQYQMPTTEIIYIIR